MIHFALQLLYVDVLMPWSPSDLQGDFPDKFHAPSVERGWYQFWRRRGLFAPRSPTSSSGEKTFSLVLPPPNVTGTLHLGHALTVTVQDAIVRFVILSSAGVNLKSRLLASSHHAKG